MAHSAPRPDWPSRREEVASWLSASPEVTHVVVRLTAYTGLTVLDEIENWARQKLVDEIDEVVANTGAFSRAMRARTSKPGFRSIR